MEIYMVVGLVKLSDGRLAGTGSLTIQESKEKAIEDRKASDKEHFGEAYVDGEFLCQQIDVDELVKLVNAYDESALEHRMNRA